MKNRILMLTLGVMVTLCLGSCAAMISGSNQKVEFTSNVDGAVIYQNFDSIGVTNTEIKLQRTKIDNYYTISKEGCRDTSVVLNEEFNVICLFDMINPLALLIDYGVGSHFKTDEVIHVELDCDSTLISYE